MIDWSVYNNQEDKVEGEEFQAALWHSLNESQQKQASKLILSSE